MKRCHQLGFTLRGVCDLGESHTGHYGNLHGEGAERQARTQVERLIGAPSFASMAGLGLGRGEVILSFMTYPHSLVGC